MSDSVKALRVTRSHAQKWNERSRSRRASRTDGKKQDGPLDDWSISDLRRRA